MTVVPFTPRPTLKAEPTVKQARVSIIDRTAAAICFGAGSSWSSAGAAEQDRYRAMARAAIASLTTGSPPDDEFLIISQFTTDSLSTADAMAVIDDYVAGILR